jgi:hypothetical protein
MFLFCDAMATFAHRDSAAYFVTAEGRVPFTTTFSGNVDVSEGTLWSGRNSGFSMQLSPNNSFASFSLPQTCSLAVCIFLCLKV